MLTSVTNIEKYLTLNLKKEPDFLFASDVKFLTTVIRRKKLPIIIGLLHRHNFWTKHQVSTRLIFPRCDNRDFMSDNYFYCCFEQYLLVKFSFSI